MSPRGAWIAPLLLIASMQAGASDWTALAGRCAPPDPAGEDIPVAGAVCPEAAAALAADSWNLLLQEPAAELPVPVLEDLAALAQHYRHPAQGPRPDHRTLDAVLASLPVISEERPSYWERLWNWLVSLLDDQAPKLPWLGDLSFSDDAAYWIWYGIVILLVLLAVAVVLNEIRQHIRWQARQSARRRPKPEGLWPTDDPRGAAGTPREELEALFRALVGRLQAVGLLARRVGLTHREAAATAALAEDQRRVLGAVAGAVERAVYGAWTPTLEEVGCRLESGRRLLRAIPGEAP